MTPRKVQFSGRCVQFFDLSVRQVARIISLMRNATRVFMVQSTVQFRVIVRPTSSFDTQSTGVSRG